MQFFHSRCSALELRNRNKRRYPIGISSLASKQYPGYKELSNTRYVFHALATQISRDNGWGMQNIIERDSGRPRRSVSLFNLGHAARHGDKII